MFLQNVLHIGYRLSHIYRLCDSCASIYGTKSPETQPARARYTAARVTPRITLEGWLLPIGVSHFLGEPMGSLKLTRTQLFMFGWTATSDIHWIIPSIAIALATMGIFFILLTIFNFLADNYGPYASSAIAAQSFCRNALGGCFPLVTRQMYTNLGYGPASSLCGGIASVLGLVPIILIFYGDKIRERSKFAKSIAS
jgi:hypothetical protein